MGGVCGGGGKGSYERMFFGFTLLAAPTGGVNCGFVQVLCTTVTQHDSLVLESTRTTH